MSKYLPIKIKEPWWSAWKKFGWANNLWGVGLKKVDVDYAITEKKLLKITIWKFKKSFVVDPQKVKKYSQENKTQFLAKYGVLLYVVPETILNATIN